MTEKTLESKLVECVCGSTDKRQWIDSEGNVYIICNSCNRILSKTGWY